MSLGKRKSTRKEYHIPNDIKAHITEEFGREFLNQLSCVYSNYDYESEAEWFDDMCMYCEGTGGWYTALEKTAEIMRCRELIEYYNNLEWYDSDQFDGRMHTIIKGYNLFD